MLYNGPCLLPFDPQRYSLHVTVHSAQLKSHSNADTLFCCAQVASLAAVSAKVRTNVAPVAPSSGSDRVCASWEEVRRRNSGFPGQGCSARWSACSEAEQGCLWASALRNLCCGGPAEPRFEHVLLRDLAGGGPPSWTL